MENLFVEKEDLLKSATENIDHGTAGSICFSVGVVVAVKIAE